MNKKRKRTRSKKVKTRSLIKQVVIGSFLSLALALVAIFIYIKLQKPQDNPQASFQEKVLGYEQIRDDGSLLQIKNLLHELRSRKTPTGLLPVKLDTSKKIVEISNTIIEHPDCSEVDRVFAIQSKLQAVGVAYRLAIVHGLDDPFVAEQLIGTAQQYLDDDNNQVARDAHLALAKGLVSETIHKRFLGGSEKVEQSLVGLVERFPEDPLVLAQLKDLFTSVRSFDGAASLRLAERIAELTEVSESQATIELSRFMKDIILLFDAGIGNFTKIGSVVVDDADFMQRLNRLNDDLESGPTVIKQLNNGIEYFEKQKKFELALELSRDILRQSADRKHPTAATEAKTAAENGIKRNSLVGKKWVFDGVDILQNPIDSSLFKDRVVLIVFFQANSKQSTAVAKVTLQVARQLTSRPFSVVMVEVNPQATPSLSVDNPLQFTTIRSYADQPHPFVEQCPTDKYPYGVLIDKNGIVDSINIEFGTVKTHIEELLARD